jgi:3alpha(or 20beta)-hydroxysteroid dehydrogenase
MADSDEVTRLVLFVASEEAAYIKGAEFVIEGGLPLGPASKPK